MSIKVMCDLDGTIFNLYGRENWLEMLQNEQAGAFTEDGLVNNGFLPEIDITKFYQTVNRLMERGVQFSVITWLPMQASPEYEEICRAEKMEWIRKNLPFVSEISIVSYGVPKQNCIKKRAQKMILIDDNIEICKTWETAKQRKAMNVNSNYNIVEALEEILAD